MLYPTETNPTGRLARLYLSGLNPNTLAARERDLRAFAVFIGEEDLAGTAAAFLSRGAGEAHAIALEWRGILLSEGKRPTTINRHLSSLRGLVKLGRMLGLVSWALEIPSLKVEAYRDTRGPGREVIRGALRELAGKASPAALRDAAILWLLVSPALRASEICSLDREAINLEGKRIEVLRKGKTAPQWLSIPDQAARALRAWMDSPSCPRGGALFVSLDNRSKGHRLVRSSINRICKRAGVGRPHGLRHSGVTIGLDATKGDVRSVQKFAGHASPATTMIYDDARMDIAGRVAQQIADMVG